MKRLSLLCLSLLALSIFVQPVAAEWTGKILMWDYPTWRIDEDNYQWQKNRIAEFEESHPGVEIELVEIPWSGGPEKLDVAVQSGSYPDIARGPLRTHYIKEGVVEPVGRFLTEEDKNDYLPNALEGYSIDGKLYGFPFYMTSMTMLLNLDLFEERGVEPPEDGIWTWEEFKSALKKLTFDSDGDGRIDTYGFAASAMPPDNQHLWPFIYAEGVKLFNEEDEFGFVKSKAIEALKRLQEITTSNEMSMPNASGYGEADIYMMFKNGKVAVTPIGAYAVPAISEDKPDMNIGTAYYPVGAAGKPVNTGAVSAYYIFKQDDPEKLKLLAEFARMLTRSEEQKKLFNYGTFPARKSAIGIYEEEYPEMKLIEEGLDQVIFLPPYAAIDKIVDEISRQIQMILLGNVDPETGMKAAERKIRRILMRSR